MASPAALLEGAADALILGNIEEALRQLSLAEKRMEKLLPSAREDLRSRLDRLVFLAQAAVQGIEDARGVISSAGASARIVTTYNRSGDAKKVHVTKPALGRF